MGVITTRNHNTGKGPAKYKQYFGNDLALSSTAMKGLKPEAVFDFISTSKLSNSQVEQLLNKTIKTFTSYKANSALLDATTSEKLLKLFALYDKGALIFGTAEEFNTWLNMSAAGLGEMIPATMLNTITGIELVTQELIRIEYGDLA